MTIVDRRPNPHAAAPSLGIEPGEDGVMVDVDGDGTPDRVTLAPHPALTEGQVVAARDHGPGLGSGVLVARPDGFLPVIPPWLRSRDALTATCSWWLRRQRHRVAFHSFRLPLYTGRVLRLAPLGGYRLTVKVMRWSTDWSAGVVEQTLATTGTKTDVELYMKLREQRGDRVRARTAILLSVGTAGAGGSAAFLMLAPGWAQAAAGVTSLLALAKAGVPQGATLTTPTMLTSQRYRELTDVIVARALRHAGLGGTPAKIDKDGKETEAGNTATLASPIARAANGQGYVVVVDLPYGKTIKDAATATDKIASGLDVDELQVVVEKVPGSERRVTMYVADVDPFTLKPRYSGLTRAPKVSVWDPHPLGTDLLGRELRPSLIFNSFLVGGVPRMGKTVLTRVLVSPGILDPFCDITVLDLKGGKDWIAAQEIAVAFRSGDDDEDLLFALEVISMLKQEARARFAEFRSMSDEQCPEGKLTPGMGPRLRPHLIIIDEVQNILRATDRQIAKMALADLVWLAKTAPAAGFVLVMATQRPAAEVIPSDLRDNTSVRAALRTKTRHASDAILGEGIASIGFGTHRFLEEHKGAAIVGGVSNGRGGDLSYIRTDNLTNVDFGRLCRIGRQRREDAGTLRGAAAGNPDGVVITIRVVEDVLAVWPGSEPKVQAHELLTRLQEVWPDRYGAWGDPKALTRALSSHGVESQQVWAGDSNRRGYALDHVRQAASKALASTAGDG